MRIKKGSRVEVWSMEAAPMGAWRAGEVLWGNGHSYIVRYDHGHGLLGVDPLSGRIPRKSIRPCPPDIEVPGDWGAGDMVEVFDDYEWKCAEIRQVDDDGQFDVRVVGSAKVVRAGSGDLRVRQTLREDDEWVVLHKDNQRFWGKMLPSCADVGRHGGDIVGSMAPAFKCTKRKRNHFFVNAEVPEDVQKVGTKRIRAEEEGRYQSSKVDHLSELPAKMDGCANAAGQKDLCLENCKEMSSDDCDVVGTDDDEDDSDDDDDNNETETASSSVGSSNSDHAISANRSPEEHNSSQEHNFKTHPEDQMEYCLHVGRDLTNGKEVIDGQVHHLELTAYNALMMAFYASGPLSWEQEDLLTNIRLHLHISSEEHLQAIKKLRSCTAKETLKIQTDYKWAL